MGVSVSAKETFIERHHKTPLQGEILPDDPRRPDRKNIAFPPGRRVITLSVPQASHDTDKEKTPFVYHHNGNEAESNIPHVDSIINPKTGKEEYIVDFGQGRRDVEFTVNPGTNLAINLRGVNGRVRSSMIIKAGSEGEVVVSAEGQRNRWLTIKEGIAEEVHVKGFDSGTDDDLRVVIGKEAFVRHLHLYDNAAGETKDATLSNIIGTLHVHGKDALLNNIKLKPGHTLNDMPSLIALGREGSRRAVDPDTFHPGTPHDRRLYDDPEEQQLAIAAEETEARWRLREPVLRERRNLALAYEARHGQQVFPPTSNERGGFFLSSLLRRSRKDSEPSPVESHISLITVDAHDSYLATVVMHAFHKAMIDYTDEDMRIALALAYVVTPADQRPPRGKTATIVGDDGLRIITDRNQHEAVKKAINIFMYGDADPSYKAIRHVSELAKRTEDGWGAVSEIDSLLQQRAEQEATNKEIAEIKGSAATNILVAPHRDALPEVFSPAQRRELAEVMA